MQSSSARRAAVLFGALSVLAIPVGIAAAQLLRGVRLLEATSIAVPAGFVLGLVAVAAARRARYRVERSIRRAGERTVRLGRFLAWAGLYLAVTGALALAVYGILRWSQ